METIHTAEARALVELQRRDAAIDALAARAAALPDKAAALKAAFEERRRLLNGPRETLSAMQRRKKDAELKLAEAEENIRKHQRELNMVRDNAAFKALLTEIESDKKAKDDLETEELTLLDEIDKAAAADKTAQAELKRVSEAHAAELAAHEAEAARTAAELEAARKERAAAAAALAPDLLERYETVRASRGLAVAPVKEDAAGKLSCGGCHMALTPQKALDVRKADTFAICSECRRLMYLERTIFG